MNQSAVALEEPRAFFAYERFRFTLEVVGFTVLPPFKGAVFRGAFVEALRRAVCAAYQEECAQCLLRQRCLYVAFCEPSAPENFPDASEFGHAPPPFVLNPPLNHRKSFRPGETLEFELVLIGPAVSALPYFVFTFHELGRKGLGEEHGKYHLNSVDFLRGGEAIRIYDGGTRMLADLPSGDNVPPHPEDGRVESVTLHFLTPLRLKEEGDLVTGLTFPAFFIGLAQRIALLSTFYGSQPEPPDFTDLLPLSRKIQVSHDELHWYEWERYSSRQNGTRKLGGLRGRISFTGPLGPFMPLLRLGEHVNLGQNTSFGLGRYELA